MAQPWGWLMANYRFYVLDEDDHVREPPRVFECPDDATAVEQAVPLVNGRVVEVWDHSRRVVRLEPLKRPPTIETSAVRMVADRYMHVYDSDDLRLLSAALSDALELVQKSAGGPLTETETSDFSERLAANLFRVFDSGERDPAALKRAALKGVLWAPRNEMNGAPAPSAGTGRVPTSGTVSSA